ncbi:MAG TPA: hypothetical protein VF590_08990 [Isosphaeraceae bacterium]
MPRSRWTLIALGLTGALPLLARVADAQVDIRNRAPNPSPAPAATAPTTSTATTAPAAEPAKDAPEAAADDSAEAQARRKKAQENADRVARMDLSDILEVPEIQRELKLTERQKTQLKATDQYLEQSGANSRRVDRSTREALRGQAEANMASVLTRSQMTRLQQIVLRAKGPMAVAEPEMAVQLQMTPVQMQQIQTIVQQMEMKRSAARRTQFMSSRNRRGEDGQETPAKAEGEDQASGANGERPRSTDPTQEIKEQAIQEIGKVLTSGQRTNFNRKLGPPFDFAILTIAGGDSGGDRGGDRGGGRGGFTGGPGGPGGFTGGPGGTPGGFGGDRGGRGGPRR